MASKLELKKDSLRRNGPRTIGLDCTIMDAIGGYLKGVRCLEFIRVMRMGFRVSTRERGQGLKDALGRKERTSF